LRNGENRGFYPPRGGVVNVIDCNSEVSFCEPFPAKVLDMFCPVLIAMTLSIVTTPYQNGAVGIEMELPEGAQIVATNSIPPSVLILGGNSSNVWHLRVDKGLNLDGLTPTELVHMARNRREDPPGTVVIADRAMEIQGIDAWWLLLHQPEQDSQSIIGWLAVPVQGKQYIMASILMSDGVWEAQKSEILAILSSIEALDMIELVKKRIQGHDAAIAMLESISESTLRPLLGFEEWRLIKTKQSGVSTAVDIGYASISIEEGYAHEIDEDHMDESAAPEGIVITVKSRVIPNPDIGLIVDTRAQYWISWDGKEDRWWNRVTRSIGKSRTIESETGIRSRPGIGSPNATLLVIHEDLMASTIKPLFKVTISEPWLPRALVWIIGPMLAQDTSGSHYVWSTFDNVGEMRVVLRTDSIVLEEDGTKTITTRFGEGMDVMKTHIDQFGHLINQQQVGGVILTGSTEEECRRIWEPKGLW